MRAATEDDLAEFDRLVFSAEPGIDPDDRFDWADIARGFLLARGVDNDTITWELTAAMTCGDWERALTEIAKVVAA